MNKTSRVEVNMSKEIKKLYTPQDDPQFQSPYIDLNEERKRVVNGREIFFQYYHGGFKGTNVKFSFSFPRKETYQGRFYHYLSPFPGPDEEIASQGLENEADRIAFALVHGAYFVESNMGSGAVFGSENDPTIFYRSSSAVAEYSRRVAQEIYGEHRVYGYVYGGSGGGYKTMSCIENTRTWDGAVPYVIGSPVSLPNCLTVWAHGMRLLRNAFPKIVDALEPGGSGDMYAGLNDEETVALKEITRMGIPPRTLYAFASMDDGSLPVLAPTVHMFDSTYFTDFWTKPGYLGAEPNSNATRDRIKFSSKVVSVGMPTNLEEKPVIDSRNSADDAWRKFLDNGGEAFIELEEVPRGDDLYLRGVNITFESGQASGKRLMLDRIVGNKLIMGKSYGMDDLIEVLNGVKPGDHVLLDNSDYIAIQTYHRHQVPEDKSFVGWNQYRDEKGDPIYPQRENLISFGFTYGGCGSVQDGQIQGKVIVINNLMDGNFPWQADWYRRKVEEVKGSDANNSFRLWFNDNCPHGDQFNVGEDLRVTSYLGILNQALLDLSKWVEKGIPPSDTTGYKLENSQIILVSTAKERKGIQPLVTLYANDGTCAKVQVGEEINFKAVIDVPEGTGACTLVEWSFEGEADYPTKGGVVEEKVVDGINRTVAKMTKTYDRPGTYFAVVRVSSNRNKDKGDIFTQVRNLCRVRVIVE